MSTLERRDLLKALAALPAASLAQACAAAPRAPSTTPAASSAVLPPRQPGWSPALFDSEQALTLEDVAEALLPETDTPGAIAAGVPAYIESLVKDVFTPEERRDFIAGIDALNVAARQAHASPFPACTPEQRTALLAALATRIVEGQRSAQQKGREPALDPLSHFWLSMRELTVNGYCGSKLGATRLFAYDPIPGEYHGCVSLESVGKTWAL